MNKKVITIDGPAGAGKSTVSKALAERLQYIYLDTGALYRALAHKALKKKIDFQNEEQLNALCRETNITLNNIDGKICVHVDGENVEGKIRTEEVGLAASTLSAFGVVREKLLSIQREAGVKGGIVAEGRDMGSVVFPDAEYKFYLDADLEERTQRRYAELKQNNNTAEIAGILQDMKSRDQQDSQRKIAPLMAAPDAIVIDSTGLNVNEVVELMMRKNIRQRSTLSFLRVRLGYLICLAI